MLWIAISTVALALCVAPPCAQAKVRLSSPVTHSDWILANNPPPAWGEAGVKQILDRAKECGWTRVYWRCFDSGKSMYASKLLEPFDQGEPVKPRGRTRVFACRIGKNSGLTPLSEGFETTSADPKVRLET